jgi:hypothetical protein
VRPIIGVLSHDAGERPSILKRRLAAENALLGNIAAAAAAEQFKETKKAKIKE